MIISTQTSAPCRRYGEQEGVRFLCELGYDALDYSMFLMKEDNNILNTPNFESHILELKDIAESYGKFFNQAHAMFPSLKDGDDEYNEKYFPRVARGVEIAGILGATSVVVHPVAFEKDQFEKNMEMYHKLEPIAKEYGVKIALENMWGRDGETKKIIPNVCSTAEDFPKYVDALNPDYFTACLDLGHCGLVGDSAPNMIRALGHNRLTCLHIHDNDNIADWHFPPFTMKMEWKKIVAALKEIDYTGDFTLEADGLIERLPDEMFRTACQSTFESVVKLRDMYEAL